MERPRNAREAADKIRAAISAGDQATANRVWELYVYGGNVREPGSWGYDSRKADIRATKMWRLGVSMRGTDVALHEGDMKMDCTQFRDSSYGAASYRVERDCIVSTYHGLQEDVHSALERVLSLYSSSRRDRGGETVWVMERAHPLSVLSTLKQEMRLQGFVDHRLAENSIRTVSVAEARRPDLPSSGKVMVHEAVEDGVKQQLKMVVAALRESSQASVPSVRYYPRPHAESVNGRRPPFAVARFFVESTRSADELQESVLEGLAPWADYLEKLSVMSESETRYAVEVGLALPGDVCESFLEESIPRFMSSDLIGVREVTYALSEQLTDEEINDIVDLGRVCTGCVSLRQEGRTLKAQVPSGFIGSYAADKEVNERVAWLTSLLSPWGADLRDIGSLSEMSLEPEPRRAELRELGESMVSEDEESGDDIPNYGLPADVNTLVYRFSCVKADLWDTPPVKTALRKAKELVKDEHGKDIADKFDTQLDIARATAKSVGESLAEIERVKQRPNRPGPQRVKQCPPTHRLVKGKCVPNLQRVEDEEEDYPGRDILKSAGTFVSDME